MGSPDSPAEPTLSADFLLANRSQGTDAVRSLITVRQRVLMMPLQAFSILSAPHDNHDLVSNLHIIWNYYNKSSEGGQVPWCW